MSRRKPRPAVNLPQTRGAVRRGSAVPGAVAIVVLTIAAYGSVLPADYIWDDDYYVTNNVHLRTAEGLSRIWFEVGATTQYYPLVYTTFWVEYHLWELNPFGYHLINVLLHALGAVLLWLVLRRLAVPGAWIAAAVFAVHPVHVMSVAWITERKNVLSGVFYFAAMLTYLRFSGVKAGVKGSGVFCATGSETEPRKRLPTPLALRWRFYGLSFGLLVCALLSKTVTGSLPAAVLLIIWWKAGRVRLRDVVPLVPMFVVCVFMGLLTAWVERHTVGAGGSEWSAGLGERFLLAGRIVWFYLGKLVWPARLTFIYPRWEIDAGLWWQYLYPAAALGLLVLLWRLRGRWGRGPLVAALFFGGTLLPALGFFDVFMMRYSYVTDHWQYLASVGPITVLAALLAIGLKLPPSRLSGRWVVPGVLLVVLGTLTWRQGYAYENEETLWRHTLDQNPSAWIAHNNLGTMLKRQGRPDEAMDHYRWALKYKPDFADAHNNLGTLLVARGEIAAAIEHYHQALERWPRFAVGHYNLAKALLAQGRAQEAVASFTRALEIDPDFVAAHTELGDAWIRLGEFDKGLQQYDRALGIDPTDPEAHNNLALALAMQGRLNEAVTHFERALQHRPGFVEALGGLGYAKAMLGRVDEAVELWRRALEIAPGNVRLWCLLANYLPQLGRIEEARAACRRAKRIDPNAPCSPGPS